MFETLVANVLNKFLGDYVSNLETTQLNIAIWKGDVKLRGLKLRKEALDKFNLPIDVLEGYLGELTLKIPWQNLKTQPVRVFIDNVYILATPRGETTYDSKEEEERLQKLKQEKLETAELLHTQSNSVPVDNDAKSNSFTMQLVTKIVDNLQVSINNIHIRYEDQTSNPNHPFSVGITLSELSIVSTDENWNETFISQPTDAVHKLLKLKSLGVYWDTGSVSLAGKSYEEFIQSFTSLIASEDNNNLDHQFVLKPVSGAGRLILNKSFNAERAKNVALLLFDEFGFVIDDEQYRDLLLLANLFEYSIRQDKYRSLRPPKEISPKNDPRAWLRFAGTAILSEIHEKNRKWTWDYIRGRRDNRKAYIPLYIDSKLDRLDVQGQEKLSTLERKLSFEDIRFYRSIAQRQLKREKALIAQKKQNEKPKGWLSWLGWTNSGEEEKDPEALSEKQRQELYDTIDFDESLPESAFEIPNECAILSITTQLKMGSLALRQSPHGISKDIASLVFDTVTLEFLNRRDSFKTAVSLKGLNLFDGSTEETLYPLLMRVQEDSGEVDEGLQFTSLDENAHALGIQEHENPFFRLIFEHNPLDERADDALIMKMRNLEVYYNNQAIDAILKFLRPPVSTLESMAVLMEAAGNTIDELSQQTRASLQFALEEHKTLDLKVDIDAPIFIFPESCTDPNAHVVVLDSGHITVKSELVSKEQKKEVDEKVGKQLNQEEMKALENLMYDKFAVDMTSVQILVGQSVKECLEKINEHDAERTDEDLHVVDRINMSFSVGISILPKSSNITGVKISGNLPLLKVNFSDRKYKCIMRLIDLVISDMSDEANTDTVSVNSVWEHYSAVKTPTTNIMGFNFGKPNETSNDLYLGYESDRDDDFYDTQESLDGSISGKSKNPERKELEFTFNIEKLAASLKKAGKDHDSKEVILAELYLNQFEMCLVTRPYDIEASVKVKSLLVEDMMDPGERFKQMITSEVDNENELAQDLLSVVYRNVKPESPEYASKYDSIDQSLDIAFSSVNIAITSKSVLTLYDFILVTFVDNDNPDNAGAKENQQLDSPQSSVSSNSEISTASTDKIKIKAEMNKINFILNNKGTQLSTISLSKGNVSVFLEQDTLKVSAQLGNVSVVDDMMHMEKDNLEHFSQLIAIQGDELVDFRYETFNSDTEHVDYPGYDSSVYLRLGSVQVTFLESAIREIMAFGSKFAEMHMLFESARQAAAESAAQLQNQASKMHFDIAIKSPVVIFPRGGMYAKDTLIANLGEISFENTFIENPEGGKGAFLSKLNLNINEIRLASSFYLNEDAPQILQIIDDVDIALKLIYGEHFKGSKRPDTELVGEISDIKMNLTEKQYVFLFEVFNSVATAFGDSSDVPKEAARKDVADAPIDSHNVENLPVPKIEDGTWVSLDCIFSLNTIYLEIFTNNGKQKQISDSSLCRFALNETSLKYQILTDGCSSAELQIHSLEVTDTRPNPNNKFKEIIPAVSYDDPQFMTFVRIESNGDMDLAVTIDSPKVILVLDQLFAIRDFFFSAFQDEQCTPDKSNPIPRENKPPIQKEQSTKLTYTVNIVEAEILLLGDAHKLTSEAMVLSISYIAIQQKEKLNLNANRIALFLCRMDKREQSLRVIDSFDISLSLDNGISPDDHIMQTVIDIDVQPFIIRVSYRDILIFTNIINKASELLYQTGDDDTATTQSSTLKQPSQNESQVDENSCTPSDGDELGDSNSLDLMLNNRTPPSREHLRINLDEIQIVFIRDLNDLPILDIHVAKFTVGVEDWSTWMKASTEIKIFANMFNIKNSHWEPLVEPWDFGISLSCPSDPPMTDIEFISQTQLEVNVTHQFLETALGMSEFFDSSNSPLETARGVVVPYLLRNCTGLDISVWAEPDLDGQSENVSSGTHKPKIHLLKNGTELPWRFRDWIKSRETILSCRNRLGIQFSDLPWECINDIPVDTEGTHTYLLRPKIDNVAHRLVCDVTLKESTKIVTFRSPITIENRTKVPLEMAMVNYHGEIVSDTIEVAPGENYPVHLTSGYDNAIKIKPASNNDYGWSVEHIYWREFLIDEPPNTIVCETYSQDHESTPFRFQVHGRYDKRDKLAMIYPTMAIRISAPFELENLLPFDFKYRIVDKNNKQSWTGDLEKLSSCPIHTAQLGQLLLLAVEIADAGYEFSEYAIISTPDPSEVRVEDTLILKHSKHSMKLSLKIKYFEIPDSGGAYRFSVYCPFVILNKTGTDLQIKSRNLSAVTISGPCEEHTESNTDHESHKKAIPFMLSFGKSESRNLINLKVDGTEWSKGISLEAIGTVTATSLPISTRAINADKQEVQLGMTINQGQGKVGLTRVVTFTPRYVLQNKMDRALSLRKTCSDVIITLQPGERAPLYVVHHEADIFMQLHYSGTNHDWSSPFNLIHIGTNYVKVGQTNEGPSMGHSIRKYDDDRDLVKVEISLEGPTIFVFLSKERRWPFKIENNSPVDVKFFQQKPNAKDLITNRAAFHQEEIYKAPSGESRRYAWDYPSIKHKMLILDVHGFTTEISLQAIGPLLPLKYASGNGIMAIDVVAEGPTVVLKLTQYTQSKSIFKPMKGSHTFSRKDSISEAAEFEVADVDTHINFQFQIKLEGIGISLINKRMQELIYVTLHGVGLQYSDTTLQTSTKLVIQWLQIDNQLYGGLNSTLLYPTFITKHGKETDMHPFFQAAVVKAKDTEHGVDYYKYFTVLLQDVSLEVDEDFLFALLDFAKFNVSGWDEEEHTGDIWNENFEIPEAPYNESDIQLYFEAILIQPMKISLSFARTERVNQEEQAPRSYNPVWYVLNVFTMTIGSVNDAPVKLNALLMENVRLTYPELIDRFTKHYSQEVIYQVHKIIGSADFLGNPVGLFNTVSSGVMDIFYEPYQGFIMSDRPQDLGIGIAKGTASFLSKMVYGFSDSFSKFTGSVGKGLSAATMDKAFQDRRRTARSRNRPRHALYGVTQAATSLASGVASGISGVVMQPITGAQKDGAGGFVKGIGKGLVGVVVKPMVGLVDMANNVTEGIRNTTTMFEMNDFDRVRLPRYIDPDGILRPYSGKEALGQSWLKQADKGTYFDEVYIAHLELKGEEMIALLTTRKLIVVKAKRLGINWEVNFDQVRQAKADQDSIVIFMKDPDVPPFRIHVPEISSRKWFSQKIQETLSKYDYDRRPLTL